MDDNVNKMTRATLSWDEANQPYSTDFEDHYFSSGQGREETRFVFLENNDLPSRWLGKDSCVIGELGFGTGLSFIETWAMWRLHRRAGQRLFFQSVEGFPMSQKDLTRAWSSLEQTDGLAQKLIKMWDDLPDGPVMLDEQTQLHVIFDEVKPALAAFPQPVDIWFLDGFAPVRNPAMWSLEVMQTIASISTPNARFTSYTAAGWVRRNLEQAGFQVERRKGFGNKRHMIAGHLL